MVWASILTLGMNLFLRLKKRKDFLAETIMFLTTVIVEIDYINLPVTEILKKIQSNGSCRKLDFISVCITETEKGEDFDQAWLRAVSVSGLPLLREERNKLISMGNLIGTSDAEGQKSILRLYSDFFSSYYGKAEEEYIKYGKICISVCGFIGLGIFMIIL